MKILIDMNLSPQWCNYFDQEGIIATHWSSIGKPDASDEEIFLYAKENDFVIFTHDLDFSIILAYTSLHSPSVIQLRTKDTLPSKHASKVITSIKKHKEELTQGAIVTIDLIQSRIRILPIK
ncbi:MAG: DUF5615 family PIN-like protein [Spirochaetota bacterium]